MVLVTSLFPRSPLNILAIRHVAEIAKSDQKNEQQEYEWLHNDILYLYVPGYFLHKMLVIRREEKMMHMLLEDTNYADGCSISSLSHVPERIAVSFTTGSYTSIA